MQGWFCKRCGSCCKRQYTSMELYKEEINLFPKGTYLPHIGYGDSKSDITVYLYRLVGKRCPLYDNEVGCTIYEDRPVICKRFPFRKVDGTNMLGCDSSCKNTPQGPGPHHVSPKIIEAVRPIVEEVEKQTAFLVEKYHTSNLWLYKNFKWKHLNQHKMEKMYGRQ